MLCPPAWAAKLRDRVEEAGRATTFKMEDIKLKISLNLDNKTFVKKTRYAVSIIVTYLAIFLYLFVMI